MSTPGALVDTLLVNSVLVEPVLNERERLDAESDRHPLTSKQRGAHPAERALGEQARAVAGTRSVWLDYLELTKPKIALLELVSVAVAALVARYHAVDPVRLVHALLGITLVAASASALNQWLEQERDRTMPRTAGRPLPAGRLSSREVFTFGAISGTLGFVYLLTFVNATTAWLGALSWALYVLVYTPLKVRTPLNTVVGAVAGGLPVLMGWSAVDGHFGLAPAVLFLIVFLWQFPHFMAIAWMYREDYARAGYAVLPNGQQMGRLMSWQAMAPALALLPFSGVAAVMAGLGRTGVFAVCALASALVFYSARLALLRSNIEARRLLTVSIIYLPLTYFLLMLGGR
jgi:protoheme IX farnesyltransferase